MLADGRTAHITTANWLSAKCRTARHFTINKSRYWSPIIHHGDHYQSLKLTEAQVELSLRHKLQSVTRVISRTRCGIPPSPTALTHCPHPALSRVHRSRCSGISLPGGLVTVSEFTETDNVVRMCTPHFSLAHLILIAVIQSGNRLEPRADVNDTPDKIDQVCTRQRNKVISANLWLRTFYWCSIADRH